MSPALVPSLCRPPFVGDVLRLGGDDNRRGTSVCRCCRRCGVRCECESELEGQPSSRIRHSGPAWPRHFWVQGRGSSICKVPLASPVTDLGVWDLERTPVARSLVFGRGLCLCSQCQGQTKSGMRSSVGAPRTLFPAPLRFFLVHVAK